MKTVLYRKKSNNSYNDMENINEKRTNNVIIYKLDKILKTLEYLLNKD